MKLNIYNDTSKYHNNLSLSTQYHTRYANCLIVCEGIEIKKGFLNRCFYGVLIVVKKLITLNKGRI